MRITLPNKSGFTTLNLVAPALALKPAPDFVLAPKPAPALAIIYTETDIQRLLKICIGAKKALHKP